MSLKQEALNDLDKRITALEETTKRNARQIGKLKTASEEVSSRSESTSQAVNAMRAILDDMNRGVADMRSAVAALDDRVNDAGQERIGLTEAGREALEAAQRAERKLESADDDEADEWERRERGEGAGDTKESELSRELQEKPAKNQL